MYRDYEDPKKLQRLLDEARYRLIGADPYEEIDIHEEIEELEQRINFAYQDEECDEEV